MLRHAPLCRRTRRLMEQANGTSQPGIRLMRRVCAPALPSPQAGRPLGMEALWKRPRCQDGLLTAGGLPNSMEEGIAGDGLIDGLTVTKSVRLSGWQVRPPPSSRSFSMGPSQYLSGICAHLLPIRQRLDRKNRAIHRANPRKRAASRTRTWD